MALRLAGAGKQIGMSEGDILGFAAALSSVGVEAEAGGSAFSKVMVQMQLATEKGVGSFEELKQHAADQGVSWERLVIAVRNGGKELTGVAKEMGFTGSELKKMYKEADKSKTSLEQFADVAGMTGDQFAKMFKEDPSTAIMKFVEGLSKAEESGTSAIKVLDDMDIKEVRLRDSLLRAANASGIFGEAIETGNSAFEENTALAEEAGKRYETVESQLAMLKNEVTDVAIEFGGPFLGALRDGVQAAKPFIKNIADLAQKFSEANPETQQAIMKYIGLAAAIGPVSKVLGGFLKITGGGISTVGKLNQWIGKLSGTAKASKTTFELMADGTLKLAAGASTAAGSGGVGALTTALGASGLAGALPLIVGAGGLLALGYGAWKTFGEEAWNSSQRVKRWGEDVGVEVSGTLDTVKSKTEEASGQFGLLASGVSTNTGEMANNFATIGTTLEDSLTKKIQGLDGLLKALPETVSDTMEQIVTDEKERNERSLATVEENNAHIKALREKASNENRELTISEAKQIQDLSTKSAEAYVETLDVSAEQKRAILKSMTADVSSATKEEAKAMMQSLGEQYDAQQSHYAKSRKEQEEWLKEWGYNLDGEFAQKYLDEWDAMNQATGDGFLNQMALIKEKYPELANEVHMGSGKLISEATGASDLLIKDNEKLMRSIGDMANELAENTQKNADQIALTAEAGTAAGDMWNSLELIDKEGNVKTNAQEIVNEAAKEEKNWNQMMWLAKDADVSSNAKLMIAEAAIANGKWEGLSFTEQQAMLDSNVTKTMTQAVQAKGDWAGLSFEEKKALIYSNTPETMAETMANLGLWDKYQPEIKELGAKNAEFLGVIAKSEEKLGNWNSIPAETKEILGDNYDLLKKLYESDERFNLWKQIPDAQKKILGNNEDLILKITGSEATFNAWKALPETEKKILGNNQDVLAKILSSEQEYNRWKSLPETEKHLLGNNSDLLSKVMASEGSLAAWNSLPTDVKLMLGNNQDIMKKISDGSISIGTYNKTIHPALKVLYGDNASIKSALQGATDGVNYYNRNISPNTKTMNGVDNASGPAGDAFRSVLNFKNNLPDTITKTVRANFIGPVLPGKATGDPYFQGGPVWLGDGGKREPFLTPQGDFGISPATWTPYNLPKGTKIWPSIQKMMETIPRYATGTKFDDTKLSRLSVASNNFANPPAPASAQNQVDLKEVIKLLRIIAQKNFIISKDAIGSIANKYAGESFFKLLYNGGGLN
ncbi:phage tail tape measure protein, TP901 family, core region [Enterococcus diestrammenae]|uniref:Phage tail tape measure protein, TP901 family, core region n=2 Tax=Enterococcus diestrammenae TaxID=1155073 RepID=A0ABV0F5C7_9ENTE|nr:phage tail tape measure protein [Enterococcus diestrammenae]